MNQSPLAAQDAGERNAVKPLLAFLLGMGVAPATSPIFSCIGFSEALLEQFTTRVKAGDIPVDLVTDDVIDAFAVAGSPSHCRRAIEELVASGVDVPIALEIPGISPRDMIADIQRHLLPEFS